MGADSAVDCWFKVKFWFGVDEEKILLETTLVSLHANDCGVRLNMTNVNNAVNFVNCDSNVFL